MNDRLLRLLLLGTGVFNINDYFLTTYVLNNGHDELNPIINAIVGTPLFPVLKLVVVPGALLLLWLLRFNIGKRILLYAWLLFSAYSLLMLYFRIVFL